MKKGVRRIYVEKKSDYAVKAKELHEELINYLNIKAESVRVLIRYDIENISDETYNKAKTTVFSEPPVDMIYEEKFPNVGDDYINKEERFYVGHTKNYLEVELKSSKNLQNTIKKVNLVDLHKNHIILATNQ